MATNNSINKTVPTGTIVGDTDTQTLTNKTLTAPTIGQINASSPGVKHQLEIQTDNSNSISSSLQSGVYVQMGWGQVLGNATAAVTDSVTFPVTFTTVLGVSLTVLGANSGGAVTDITGLTTNGSTNNPIAQAYSITTSGFSVNLSRPTGTFSNTAYYGYSWIAWGV